MRMNTRWLFSAFFLLPLLSLLTTAPATAGYVAPAIRHASFGRVKIVTPITSADPKAQTMVLRDIENVLQLMREWKGKVEFRVVVYADGISLLQSPSAAFKAQITKLRGEGVGFYVCNNTLKERNIDYHTLYDVEEAYIVPAGALEVGWLQTKGFVLAP